MTTLVLLPGLDGTGLLQREFAAACGSRVEVLPLAYPADRPLDYPELEALIRTQLPRDRPFFLLAESFSGPLGIRLGAAPPPGLQGLILCCTFAHPPLPACLGPLLPPLPHSLLPLGLLSLLVLGPFATPALQAGLALPGPCAARVQDFMARAADHDVGNS